MLRAGQPALGAFEELHAPLLRRRALAALLRAIDYEDQATSFIRIGPVNAVLNTLVHMLPRRQEWGGRSAASPRWRSYLWDGHDGVKMNGYNSTALWDTAFAIQAMLAARDADVRATPAQERCLERAHDFIRDNQVVEDVPAARALLPPRLRRRLALFRPAPTAGPSPTAPPRGSSAPWPWSGASSGPSPSELLRQAVELILSFQNRDGGWSTYELRRGGAWLERLNPSQVFSRHHGGLPLRGVHRACVQALVKARGRFGAGASTGASSAP